VLGPSDTCRVTGAGSVVLVAYGSSPGLLACAASVWADEPDWELVVVDNGADRDEVDAVEQAGHATIVRPPRNLGFAGGCNAGAAVATGERIVFLNPDTIVSPGSLSALVEPLDDPGIGIVTGCLRLNDRPEVLHAAGTVVHVSGIGWSSGYGTPPPAETGIIDVPAPCGAAMAIRADTLRDLGGFHDELFLYLEDVELGWRARMAGARVVCSLGADFYHDYDFERHAAKRYFLERNRLAFLAVCYSKRTLFLLAPLLVATEIAMLAFAAREGWLRDKLAGWGWLVRNARGLLRRRREAQRRRRVGDRDLAGLLTAVVDPGMVEVPAVVRALNPLLLVYWTAIRRAL